MTEVTCDQYVQNHGLIPCYCGVGKLKVVMFLTHENGSSQFPMCVVDKITKKNNYHQPSGNSVIISVMGMLFVILCPRQNSTIQYIKRSMQRIVFRKRDFICNIAILIWALVFYTQIITKRHRSLILWVRSWKSLVRLWRISPGIVSDIKHNLVIKGDWDIAAYIFTVGERTVALKIIACCSITQTLTGQWIIDNVAD